MTEFAQSVFEVGAVIGDKYRVDQQIGEGGMGAVYAVTHVELGRRAAIKTLLPEFLGNETAVKRFRQEAQLAASIGHDNICEVTDIGTTDDGALYLVMPLLTGAPLNEVLEQKGLSLAEIADIVGQTLSALEAAHGNNIIHRDLKLENIYVTRVGDRENFVKLLDFGISKILEDGTHGDLTQTGVVPGTPSYMAPEQARGDEEIDHRVDVYAMGVVLYRLLTGERPFTGGSLAHVIANILSSRFAPPSAHNETITAEVEAVVLKAMSHSSEERYESAVEMRDALVEAAARAGSERFQSPALAVAETQAAAPLTETRPERPADTVEATPSASRAFAVTDSGDSMIPVETGSVVEFERAEDQTKGEETAPSRRPIVIGVAALALLLVLLGVLLVKFTGGSSEAEQPVVVPVAPPLVAEDAPSATPEPPAEPDTVKESDSDEEKKPVTEKLAPPQEPAEEDAQPSPRKKRSRKKKKRDEEPDAVLKGRYDTKFVTEY